MTTHENTGILAPEAQQKDNWIVLDYKHITWYTYAYIYLGIVFVHIMTRQQLRCLAIIANLFNT